MKHIINYLPNYQLDEVQSSLARKLEAFAKIINRKKTVFNFFNSKHTQKGVYLYGGVGRGKTMLLRAFYEIVQRKKKLIHYQDFMQSVHKDMHQLQRANKYSTNQIICNLADKYSKKFKTLCLDEFEIKDIADAMIIGRLFDSLIQRGIFIAITTNTMPADLYKDGLQRELFLPFIQGIEDNFAILHLDNHHDYRLDHISNLNNRILYPLNESIKEMIASIKKELTDDQVSERILTIFGRNVHFARTYKTILVTNFEELFSRELGASDYVSICQSFTIIIVEDVQKIHSQNTDVAIRFINFIDNAYFNKVLLFITMECEPKELYKDGTRSLEFQRTLSRLQEMNSNLYLQEFHDK